MIMPLCFYSRILNVLWLIPNGWAWLVGEDSVANKNAEYHLQLQCCPPDAPDLWCYAGFPLDDPDAAFVVLVMGDAFDDDDNDDDAHANAAMY